jgi:hypothetical protein
MPANLTVKEGSVLRRRVRLTEKRARRSIIGRVLMTHDDTGWHAYDPFGRLIDTSTSQSQGLQEAINYACVNGYALKALGGTQTGNGDDGRITCQQPIIIPAGAKGNYDLIGVSLYFPNAWDSQGLIFDSFDLLDFSLTGQIIYPGNDAAVVIRPSGSFNEGDDAFQVATSSRIYIQTIAIVEPGTLFPTHAQGTGLVIDPVAPVTFNTIQIDELNGGVTPIFIAPGSYDPDVNNVNISFAH